MGKELEDILIGCGFLVGMTFLGAALVRGIVHDWHSDGMKTDGTDQRTLAQQAESLRRLSIDKQFEPGEVEAIIDNQSGLLKGYSAGAIDYPIEHFLVNSPDRRGAVRITIVSDPKTGDVVQIDSRDVGHAPYTWRDEAGIEHKFMKSDQLFSS